MIVPLLLFAAGFMLGSLIGVAFGKAAERARSDDAMDEVCSANALRAQEFERRIVATKAILGAIIEDRDNTIRQLREQFEAEKLARQAATPAAWGQTESQPTT